MNAGQRTWLRWSQVRNPRRINRTAPMVKSPPHHPQPSPRASRPSFRRRDGRRSRKPGARACRCGQSNGSWASTGPPSEVIWRPEVLQDGSSGWRPIRRHRIPWQRNGVAFSLNTYPDIFPDLRHPSGTFCRRPLQEHFLTASTRRDTHLFGGLGLSKWNFHRDGPTDCAIGGVSPIYWPLRCQLEIRGRVQFRGRFGMDD